MNASFQAARRRCNYTRAVAALLAATGALAPAARAANIYWDGITDAWETVANWSTDPAATTPDPVAVPGAADIAIFNISTVNGPETVSVNATQSALGLVFNNTGATTIQAGGVNQTLNLGGSGIVVNAGAGPVTIGSATAGQNVTLALTGAETWTNNSTSLLTINNGVTSGNNLLTVNGSGSTSILGVIGGGSGGLTKSGNGILTLSGANTYTGVTSVLGGTLVLAAAAPSGAAGALGNSATAVLLGDTTGAVDASLLTSAAVTIARAVTVQAGNTGVINIGGSAANAAIYSGAIALNKSANFTAASGGTATFTGIVSGTGSLTKAGAGMVVLSGANTYTGGTIVSAGTLRGTVAAAFGVSAGSPAINLAGGTLELFNDANTTFTNTATTMTASSTVTANRATSAGTTTTHTLGTLSIGGFTLTVTRGANITGTTATGGITFGATTLTGNATVAPGTNALLTLGAVGGAFSFTQNGAGTTVLSAAGTYSGGTNLSAGILQLNNATAAGTGTITYTTSGSGRLRLNGGVTMANNLIINTGQAGATGEGLIQQVGTGLATVNGTITLNGLSGAGGVFVGGTAVGNELVINGAINGPGLGLSQREGRVIYKGGGTASSTSATTNLFVITNTAIVGATNGIPIGLAIQLGGSGNATLDLNGFDQTLAGIVLGNGAAANNNLSTITLGARKLTLTGDINDNTTTTANVTHVINATAGGSVDVGFTGRTFTITDSLAADDLRIDSAAITGFGGVTKAGVGTLALRNVTMEGPLTVNAGTLATGTSTLAGNIATSALTFGPGLTNLRMKIGPGADLISAGALATSGGLTTVNLTQFNGALAPGTYNLITYSGVSPGLANFLLGPTPGHAIGTLTDTGTAIAYTITSNDRMIWDGTVSPSWNTFSPNWLFESTSASDFYIENDEVVFKDNPLGSAVDIAANVSPSKVSFTNTSATTYTVTGVAGMAGFTTMTKTGNGTLILRNPNSYAGATSVNQGTLELDHDATGNVVLTGTSGISVAAGATLKLTRDDGNFTFDRSLSGAGTVIIDPHSAAGAGVRDITISGNSAAFAGVWRLSPTVGVSTGLGTFRTVSTTNQANLGSADIVIDAGGQLWFTGALTNNITISGMGYAETAGATPAAGTGLTPYSGTLTGGIGAMRLGTGVSGKITLNGNAKLGAFGSTSTLSGSIGVTNAADILSLGGGSSANTFIFTGTNNAGASPLGAIFVNAGSTAAVVQLLQIGANGTSGTVGVGPITLNGDTGTAALRFDRSDGYTLLPGNTITSTGTTLTNTQVQVDTQGPGLNTNGVAINLGTAAAGGSFRVGVARTGANATVSGGLTGGTVLVGATTANATLNLVSGANVSVGSVTLGAGGANAALNIAAGAIVTIANNLHVGELANNSATVNQTGGDVSFGTQLRVGNLATETSNYNISGGTLTATASAPVAFPFTTGATEQNGGIYLGVDGTGNLTQTGGTVTTNFVVLDNRTDTTFAANTPTGVDTYALNGGTLVLNNAFGIISRYNTTTFLLNGGTIRAAVGVNPALDTNRITVGSNGGTLDTNGSSIFSLYGPLAGSGTVNLVGGGTLSVVDGGAGANTTVGGTMPGGTLGNVAFNTGTGTLQVNRTGSQIWTGAISGVGTISKTNNGTLLLAGNGSGFTGTVSIAGGRLDVPSTLAASTINVADGAGLGGEPTTASVTLGNLGGGNLFINGSTPGALTVTNLTLNGNTTVDFSVPPANTSTPITVLNYTNATGGLSFALANAISYRAANFDTSVPGTVKLSLTTKNLTWAGNGGASWDVNATVNWADPLFTPETFFAGDTVSFDDNPSQIAVSVVSGVAPFKTSVISNARNYTFTSAGIGLSGPGNLEKSGASTLTLVGANSYAGQTVLSGGTVSYAAPTSLGNGGVTNSIALSGGGRLSYTGTAAMDLGATRSISVGTGGGALVHNSGTAATTTVSGSLTGTGTLSLASAAAGAGTFALTGDNSAFAGNITVDSLSTGITVLQLISQAAVPVTGSITLNYAALGATGSATTLNLPGGIVLPAGLALNLTSLQNGGISLRTQINTTGNVTINGPMTLSGGAIIQFQPTTATGVLTLNGNVDGVANNFTGTFFPRSNGTTVINGTINMPNGIFSRTDASTVIVNSTGNVWAQTATVSSGILKIGANNALPITAPLSVGQASDAANSLFDLNGFNQELPAILYVAGNANSTRAITNTSTTLSTLTINNPAPVTYGASTGVTGGLLTGNLALVKTGPSTLQLGAANTFTGGITVNQGTLIITADNNLGAVPGTATTNITINGGTLQENTGFAINANRQIAIGPNGASFNENATGNFNVNGVIKDAGPGAGALNIVGTGTGIYVPVTQNTYTGGTHLTAGTTAVINSTSTGSASNGTLVSGPYGTGTLFLDGGRQRPTTAAGTWVIGNAVQITADSTFIAGANNPLTFDGPVTLTGSRTLTTNSPGNIVFSGIIGDGGNGYSLTLGAGSTNTLVLSGANTYSGGTVVMAGTLTAGTNNVIPDTGSLQVNGTFNLAGNTDTVSNLSGGVSGSVQIGTGNLTVNVAAGTSAFDGALSGSPGSAFIKQGGGREVLTGSSFGFFGGITVNAGTLVVNGSISNGISTVNPGGTLSGGGTLGLVLVAGGTLAPGDVAHILNTGDLSLGGGTLAIRIIDGVTYDQDNMTGVATFAANTALSLDFSSYDPLDSVDAFTILANDANDPVFISGGVFTYGGNPLDEGAVFTATSGANTQMFKITYAGGDGNDVVLMAVPEPDAAWMLVGGLGALVAWQRTRRRHR